MPKGWQYSGSSYLADTMNTFSRLSRGKDNMFLCLKNTSVGGENEKAASQCFTVSGGSIHPMVRTIRSL